MNICDTTEEGRKKRPRHRRKPKNNQKGHRTLVTRGNRAVCVAWCPFCDQIAMGCGDTMLRLVTPDTGEQKNISCGSRIISVAFDPSGVASMTCVDGWLKTVNMST